MSLPLHVDTVRACACCGIPSSFIFRSQSDQVVCEKCRHHGTNDRVVQHRDWWIAWSDALVESHALVKMKMGQRITTLEQKVVEQEQKLDGLRLVALRGYESQPLGGIKSWLQEGIVVDAEAKRDAAYRQRDKVMQRLWRLDQQHYLVSEKGSRCVCGRDKCDVLTVLDDEMRDQLSSWEYRNVERSRAGRHHALPKEHPQYTRPPHSGYLAS